MNLAKVSTRGRITLPLEIRRVLNLKYGDNIRFIQTTSGEIILSNASSTAIRKAQKAFTGAAEMMGVHSEEDVQSLVDEVRYGKCHAHTD